MKFLSWNIRGLDRAFKQREVKKMVWNLKIFIMCLVETKVRQDKMDRVVSALVPGWEVLHNYGAHCYGRIWICWDSGIVSIQVMDIHEQVLTCRVCPTTGQNPWILLAIYGANQGIERRRMLNQLEVIKNFVGTFPWMLASDFNVICRQQEKWGNGRLNCYEIEFVECLKRIEVEDLPFTGCYLTWTNNQVGDWFVAKKIGSGYG
jgi:exonuclease III